MFTTISTHMAYYNFQYTIKMSNNTPSLIRRKKKGADSYTIFAISLLYFVFSTSVCVCCVRSTAGLPMCTVFCLLQKSSITHSQPRGVDLARVKKRPK